MVSVSLEASKSSRRSRAAQPSNTLGLLRMIALVGATFAALVAAIWLSSHRSCQFVVCRLDASPATTGLAIKQVPPAKRP